MLKKISVGLVIGLILIPVSLAVSLKKFSIKTKYVSFMETPTRYILIDRGKYEGDIGSPCGINYYEMDKKTGRSLMIKNGGTINNRHSYSFKGYEFNTDKHKYYSLSMQGSGGGFGIIDTKVQKQLALEELRAYLK